MNFGTIVAVVLLLGALANYVIVRVENGHLRKRIDLIAAEKIVALNDAELRLKTASEEYSSCSVSKSECVTDLESARSKIKEKDERISVEIIELEKLKKKVSEFEKLIENLTRESKTRETEIERLREVKNEAVTELQSCKEGKENLLQNLKKEENKEKIVPVVRPLEGIPSSNDGDKDHVKAREKIPSPNLEKDEIDEYNDNAKEENHLDDARSEQETQNVVVPNNGNDRVKVLERPSSKLEDNEIDGYKDDDHDRVNTGEKGTSSKLENKEIGGAKDIDNEEKHLNVAKSEKEMQNGEGHDRVMAVNRVEDSKYEKEMQDDEGQDHVMAREKILNSNFENDEIDETKDFVNEDNYFYDAKIPSKMQIQKAELPDVNPNSVNVVNRDQIGNKYHEDRNGNQVPVLPKDDPKAMRAKAEHSVMDLEQELKTTW